MSSVSVLLPIHRESFEIVKNTINSILSQDYQHIETLILFDGDFESQKPIKTYLNEIRISYYEREKSSGLASCLNFLISKCNSDFLARIDADDIMTKDRISKQVQYLEKHKNIDLIGSPAYIINNSGELLGYKKVKCDLISLEDMLKNTEIIHPSVMVRRSFFNKYGHYDESLKYSQDLELWLKAISSGAQFINLDRPLLLLRQDENLVKRRKHEQKINIQLKKRYIKNKNKFRYLYKNYLICFLPEIIIDILIKLKYTYQKNF